MTTGISERMTSAGRREPTVAIDALANTVPHALPAPVRPLAHAPKREMHVSKAYLAHEHRQERCDAASERRAVAPRAITPANKHEQPSVMAAVMPMLPTKPA